MRRYAYFVLRFSRITKASHDVVIRYDRKLDTVRIVFKIPRGEEWSSFRKERVPLLFGERTVRVALRKLCPCKQRSRGASGTNSVSSASTDGLNSSGSPRLVGLATSR